MKKTGKKILAFALALALVATASHYYSADSHLKALEEEEEVLSGGRQRP